MSGVLAFRNSKVGRIDAVKRICDDSSARSRCEEVEDSLSVEIPRFYSREITSMRFFRQFIQSIQHKLQQIISRVTQRES